MQEVSKPISLPPIGKHIQELQEQLRQSIKQHKTELYKDYEIVKKKRLKEIYELNKYNTLQRKGKKNQFIQVFNSQNKHYGGLIEKELDIYLCKEPLIDDYLKVHIIDPQRNLEKGLVEIKTGLKELPDGSCFGDLPISKQGEKERKLRQYWMTENKRLAEIKYKALLDTQTGIQKKINQSQRLKNLKIFIPNKFTPSYFDEHPSQILTLTYVTILCRQMHQHSQTSKWKPNSFYGEEFESSFCKQSELNKSLLKEVEKNEEKE